jgi:hypothetical protein
LQQFKFNSKTGFKLVVDGGLMTGQRFKDIQYDVDRYLFKDGERKALPDKPVSTEALKVKTATSKSTGSPSPFLAVLLGLVIGIVACGGLFFYMYYELLTEYPSLSALKQTKVQLQEDKDNLTNTIKQQTKDRDDLNQKISELVPIVTKAKEDLEKINSDRQTEMTNLGIIQKANNDALSSYLENVAKTDKRDGTIQIVKEWLENVEPESPGNP